MSQVAKVPQSQLVTIGCLLVVSWLELSQLADFQACMQTNQLKYAVNYIVKSVVPGCKITSSFAYDTCSDDP